MKVFHFEPVSVRHESSRSAAPYAVECAKKQRRLISFANAAGALTAACRGAIPAVPVLEQIQVCMNEMEVM